MSGSMTVKELITELLDCDMFEHVYIALGPSRKPEGNSEINEVVDFSIGHIDGDFGIYIIPTGNLCEKE